MDQKKIGQFIAQRRKERDMTQKQLADVIGVSDKTISKWETGNGLPDLTLLNVLCRELEINVNELLSGEKLPPETYSEKAEENIMHLLEENQKTKKSMWMKTVFGAILLILWIWFIFVSSYGISFLEQCVSYLDMPSFLYIMLPAMGASLLSGPRTKKDFVIGVRRNIFPAAVIVTIEGMILILNNIGSGFEAWIAPSFAVAILPLFYAAFLYLICNAIEGRMRSGVHETEAQSRL